MYKPNYTGKVKNCKRQNSYDYNDKNHNGLVGIPNSQTSNNHCNDQSFNYFDICNNNNGNNIVNGNNSNSLVNFNRDQTDNSLAKRAYSKLSALKALNEIYNIQKNNLESQKKIMEQNEAVGPSNCENVMATTKIPLVTSTSNWFDYKEVQNDVQPEVVMKIEAEDIATEVEPENMEVLPTEIEQTPEDKKPEVMTDDAVDNVSYSSLQMAMKSPIISVSGNPPPRPPPPSFIKRSEDPEDKAPALPPKRIRKIGSLPVLNDAPNKILPTKPAKQSLFSKFFTLKRFGSKKELQKPRGTIPPQFSPVYLTGSPQKEEDYEYETIDGNITPPYGAELTDAEHYALYTAMAPHATASEFDDMSCYYSPVEAGKILLDGKTHS